MDHTTLAADAARHDAEDPLAPFRDRFILPDGIVYLDGNSLGPLPTTVGDRLADVVDQQWGQDLITSWNVHRWIDLPHTVGDKIGRLIGAAPGQVIAGDSTSISLFKALAAACGLRADRRIILSDQGNFPTDLYIADALAKTLGVEVRLADAGAASGSLDETVAVLTLTPVNYRTGALQDMGDLTRRAHDVGALVVWDLAHSAGVLQVDLDGIEADFAVGCGYKYLNGGPGAPAFLYAARRHHDRVHHPLTGWLGHDAPFDFDLDYRPAQGIRRFQVGTPPILSLSALDSALDVVLEADPSALTQKAQGLTSYFIDLIDPLLDRFDLTLATPRAPLARGAQVSLKHEHGYAIVQALISRGVIGDFRSPDILRFGFSPLFLRFSDVLAAVRHLEDIMQTRGWDKPEFHARAAVT